MHRLKLSAGSERRASLLLWALNWDGFLCHRVKRSIEIKMMLTQTSLADYEELCRLDVLGLSDSSEHDQSFVYQEFKEQLVQG